MTTQNPMSMGLDYARNLANVGTQVTQRQGQQQQQGIIDQAQQRLNVTQGQEDQDRALQQAQSQAKGLVGLSKGLMQIPTIEGRFQAIQEQSALLQSLDIDISDLTPDAITDEGLSRIISTLGGGQQVEDKTNFTKDLLAAGLEAGSEEFKAAVLDKYGKGDTIGYDVVEAYNPETKQDEYYQISRVNPGEKIPLGMVVPKSSSQIKSEAADAAGVEGEVSAMQQSLDTIGKILNSPGLSGFSGLDSFRKFIPGTEAANVAAWIDQLQSQNFLVAVKQMKGMGALSENEGRKIAGAVAALDSSMTDDAIKKELESIQSDLMVGLERIESGNLLGADKPAPTTTPTKPAFQPTTTTAPAPTPAPKSIAWDDM